MKSLLKITSFLILVTILVYSCTQENIQLADTNVATDTQVKLDDDYSFSINGETIAEKEMPANKFIFAEDLPDKAVSAANSLCGAVDAVAFSADDSEGARAADARAIWCCYMSDLSYNSGPSASVTWEMGEANYFEATAWFLRIQRTQADGTVLLDVVINDPTSPGSDCALDINAGYVFNCDVGPLCTDIQTVRVTRLYQINFQGPLYRCCSKTISFNCINPNGDPCA